MQQIFFLIRPILFLYYEESLVSSNLGESSVSPVFSLWLRPCIAYVIGAGRKIEHVSGFLWPLNNWPVLILKQTVNSNYKNENTFSLKGCHISYISENNLCKFLGLAISILDLKCVKNNALSEIADDWLDLTTLISLKGHVGFENI